MSGGVGVECRSVEPGLKSRCGHVDGRRRRQERAEARGQRSGFGDEAQRLLGRARTELEYRPLAEIVEAMPIEMERLQRTCAAASEAVGARYFSHSDTHAWTGGVSL